MATGDAAAVIGKSVQIRGEVKGNEDLLVEGVVEGTVALSESRLTIGVHARVQANLSARDVVVLGTVTGDVEAVGRVELRAGCLMKGDIHAGRLSIEENAVFSGKVELTGGTSATAASATSAAVSAPAAAAPSGALFGAKG
ncbi:MAG TPA: polymer-forming cytoskeletal protein [Acidobacteriaceae bacterium]|jgi:cytoskeletal protein CcmA (bactofilin family)|nr:polymer-forming cytoskeletal protein [Acidobacteriaceae bacterium]